ncbi:hypothetical protein ACHAPT_002449 [Fusarium lateritium]
MDRLSPRVSGYGKRHPAQPFKALELGNGYRREQVLKTIEENKPSVGKFNLQEHLMGGCSVDATGSPLTDETAAAAAAAADAVLLGSIGGPE